jgi:acetyl-CoA carboxylase alpha subunit
MTATDDAAIQAAIADTVGEAVALLATQAVLLRMVERACTNGGGNLPEALRTALRGAERDASEMVQQLGEVRGMPRKLA